MKILSSKAAWVSAPFHRTYSLFKAGTVKPGKAQYVVNLCISNLSTERKTKDLWYHLERRQIGSGFEVACYCPNGDTKSMKDCVHKRLIKDDLDLSDLFPVLCTGENFLMLRVVFRQPTRESDTTPENCVLFSRERLESGLFKCLFSVALPQQALMKSRVIVTHKGDNLGNGDWRCLKDSGTQSCQHIIQAQSYLRTLNFTDSDIELPEDNVREILGSGSFHFS